MAKKVVVVGSGGQLGVELVKVFRARGAEVHTLERSQLDITDATRVEQVLASLDPELVINSAAYNQVDVAETEPQAAFLVNALAVRNLAVTCRQMDAKLVHFSTDYVFDGTKGQPYLESDVPHPLGAYAVSKLAGELYAQAYLDHVLVLRTSGVFGPGGLVTARGNFIELMLRLASSGNPIRVVEDHVASPTFAPALAECCAQIVDRGLTGLFHTGGGTPISWFEYARMIFEEAGLSPELRPTNEREYRTAARRPKFSALANARLATEGLPAMPPLRECVANYLKARAAMLASSAPVE